MWENEKGVVENFAREEVVLGERCARLDNCRAGLTSTECAQCGYPAAKMRSYNWGLKAKRRMTT
jgi:ribosomal protein L37E